MLRPPDSSILHAMISGRPGVNPHTHSPARSRVHTFGPKSRGSSRYNPNPSHTQIPQTANHADRLIHGGALVSTSHFMARPRRAYAAPLAAASGGSPKAVRAAGRE